MARTGLYLEPLPSLQRASLSLDPASLALTLENGHTRHHELDGCAVVSVDACCQRRFVKMLILERTTDGYFAAADRLILITPPDSGAIAPSAVRLPVAPSDAIIIDAAEWEVLHRWLSGGGRLSACSVVDLARLAAIASPQFAVVIGEVAADIAVESLWDSAGPLRGRSGLDDSLRPLYDSARRSPRAADALIAALARAAVMPRARRNTG